MVAVPPSEPTMGWVMVYAVGGVCAGKSGETARRARQERNLGVGIVKLLNGRWIRVRPATCWEEAMIAAGCEAVKTGGGCRCRRLCAKRTLPTTRRWP